MSDKSLCTLPVELIYRIFDHLDIKTILLSARSVCKDLFRATNTYSRFKLDFRSLENVDIRLIARLVQRQGIIELVVPRPIDGSSAMNFLRLGFNLSEFTRLHALTLDNIKKADLVNCLENVTTTSLMSLKINFEYNQKENHRIVTILSSIIAQSNLQRLCLKYSTYMSSYVSLNSQNSLRYLAISNCTCREYVTVLIHCPHLYTFNIGWCTMSDRDRTVFSSSTHTTTSHRQLNSLTIDHFQLPTQCIESFFSWTPSLTRLKMISLRSRFDSIFDGSFWAQLIQNRLALLNELTFFIKYPFRSSDNFYNMRSIIASFQTPFWLNDKQWFVRCDHAISTSNIVLYTNSFDTNDDEVLIRSSALSMDQVDIFVPSGPNDEIELRQTQTLHLVRKRFGDREIQYIADALQNNTMYRTLSLDFNQIGPLGIQYLANGLGINETLTALHLRGNQIGADGAGYLAEVLQINKTLAALILCDNQIGTLGAQYIANGLLNNTTLTTLNLKSNGINALGTQYLADALQRNAKTRLTVLDLQSNNIGVSGAEYLANLLASNKTLTTLSIGDNQIIDRGVEYLSCALKQNEKLTTLNLYYNQIGWLGAEHLASALKNNKTLTTLELQGNEIGTSGATYFADAIRNNATLETLDLRSNRIDENGTQILNDALQGRKTLIQFKLTAKRSQNMIDD